MRVQRQTPLAHMQIHISLLDAVAPKTCELVSELAQSGCRTCRFYRNELPPEVRNSLVSLCCFVSCYGASYGDDHMLLIRYEVLSLCSANASLTTLGMAK